MPANPSPPDLNANGLKPPPVNGAEVDLRPWPESSGWRLLACAVLLNAGIAAVLAAGFAKHAVDAAPRIASVRLAELVTERLDDIARETADPETAARSTRDWALAFESALGAVASRYGVVLLPAQSVAAGAPDLTGAVETELKRILATGEDRP